jgi:flagellar assembly factor FliW
MTADTMTDGATILFEDGLPGFPDAHRFTIVEMIEDGAFQLLQSSDDPDLAFVVAVPWLFFPDYSPELSDVDQTGLGIESTEDAVLFCPVTLDGETRTASMNLLGPFVVNVHTRRGRQLVLTEQEFPIRATLPVEIG